MVFYKYCVAINSEHKGRGMRALVHMYSENLKYIFSSLVLDLMYNAYIASLKAFPGKHMYS